MRLSIIVASCGRPTLAHTLASCAEQMIPGDELLLSVNDDAPWGHAARQELMGRARGDALLFIDDDDEYAPGALRVIRQGEPGRLHIYRMAYADGRVLWERPAIEQANVGTPMICVPNDPARLGRWGERYEGDFDFISGCAALCGEPVWHEQVVAVIRPPT